MANIRAFRAVRPAPAYAEEIAALPYDVYDEAEARKATAGKPLSFLCIDRAETQLPEGTDPYSDAVYEKAAELFLQEEQDGYFLQEQENCYYLYSLTMNGRTQTGLAACTAVSDYLNGTCKKHENTVVKKEQDRIRHVKALSAQTGPIFLCYRADPQIAAWTAEEMQKTPLYDFTAEDGVRHTVWRIADAARIQAITERFAEQVRCTYIADGHHRAASAVKAALAMQEKEAKSCKAERSDEGGSGSTSALQLNNGRTAAEGAEASPAPQPKTAQGSDKEKREAEAQNGGLHEYDYFLSVLFSDDELEIMDYNRVVKDLNGLSPEAFLQRAGALFHIRELELGEGSVVPTLKPQEKGSFHVYLAGTGKWYAFCLNEEIRKQRAGDPVAGLDVSVLQELVLAPLLGIGDPRTDERIEFVGGIRGRELLREKADRYGGAAFSLHPTSIGELMAVADAGRLMPPKSTWFEPKLRSGLFIHKMLEEKN